jgi:CopG family nickel-responsive transcriptional regulator
VAALVYTYDHAARQLSKRLTNAYHEHHELSLASLHVHLDHDTCLEVTVLRGRTDEVQHFGEHVIAERGVRHGKIVRMPLDPPAGPHRASHPHHHRPHRHGHAEEKAERRPKRSSTTGR